PISKSKPITKIFTLFQFAILSINSTEHHSGELLINCTTFVQKTTQQSQTDKNKLFRVDFDQFLF
ncbi:hypothetical protein, partial [Acinetobacter bereziniae]|uniref:hypothetical protein n=1 Tax=Acinetobacter bereziniae TaxID=106648 RepID=UPI001C085A0C